MCVTCEQPPLCACEGVGQLQQQHAVLVFAQVVSGQAGICPCQVELQAPVQPGYMCYTHPRAFQVDLACVLQSIVSC